LTPTKERPDNRPRRLFSVHLKSISDNQPPGETT
jgi:hypothetical protein